MHCAILEDLAAGGEVSGAAEQACNLGESSRLILGIFGLYACPGAGHDVNTPSSPLCMLNHYPSFICELVIIANELQKILF